MHPDDSWRVTRHYVEAHGITKKVPVCPGYTLLYFVDEDSHAFYTSSSEWRGEGWYLESPRDDEEVQYQHIDLWLEMESKEIKARLRALCSVRVAMKRMKKEKEKDDGTQACVEEADRER